MSDEFTAGGCNPSDCASCGGGCSSAGGCDPVENHKTITLTMEDDTEVECAILTVFPVDAKEYIALLPLDENGQNESGEVYLYTFARTESGDPMLSNIESDEEYAKLQLLLTQFSRMQKILWIRLTDLLKNFICKTKIRTIIIS